MVALLVLLTFATFAGAGYLIKRRRDAAVASTPDHPVPLPIDIARHRTSPGVFFDAGHTWVFLEEEGAARLGITDFARSVIGKFDQVHARSRGEDVRRGDLILTLGRDDRTVDFRAPVDGVVEEVNRNAFDQHIASNEPFTASWIYRIKPSDTSLLASTLMIGNVARDWMDREIERLRVFLATIAPEHPVLGHTMQDGGIPVAGLMNYLDEPGWEKLRERFFG